MEFLSILLASLIGGVSPLGFIVDQRIEAAFREQVNDVETLKVRVDNTPSHRLLQGNIQRIRLAGEGVSLSPHLQLRTLALETDPIALDFNRLRQGNTDGLQGFREILQEPLQIGLQMSLSEAELTQFLNSEPVQAQLQGIIQQVANQFPSGRNQNYELLSSELEFLDNNRFAFNFETRVSRPGRRAETATFNIRLESGIATRQGKQLQFVNPRLAVNNRPFPPQLVQMVTQRVSERFNLEALEEQNILARLLKLNIEEDEVKLAAFVQIANETASESSFSSPSVTNELSARR
ncbi:DUF2993 domain-containing protein [Euhalothece natronophila Z-M001]|uniref:DUF2993 domain-containing protein n=1 Tax=Euhalothece natronophila Z-M001 TaxID=522448 RepID=A0A5B8NL02_9CHRO|nr:DUF2993 domain-containing protein [Euhalothece natronophila]QDZ40013.1 DUF2993 domain-containing protein [Euhalothece natronophila Z-M001]